MNILIIFIFLFFFFLFLNKSKLSFIFYFKLFFIVLIFNLIFFYWSFKYSWDVFITIFLIYYIFLGIFSLIFFLIYKFKINKNLFFLIIPTIWILLILIFNKINSIGFLFEISVFKPFNLGLISNSYLIIYFMILITLILSQLNLNKYNFKKQFYLNLILIISFLLLFFPNFINTQNSNPNLNSNILLIQGNFNQDWIWRYNHTNLIFETYKNLSNTSINYNLIIWPEYSIPLDIFKGNYSLKLKKLSKQLNTTLILGHTMDKYKYHYDSASVFSNGKLIGTYNSNSPVFFNEQTLNGNKLLIIKINGKRYGIIICYEELNRDMFKRYKKSGVDAIISLTNEQQIDGSFGQKLASKFVNFRAKEFNIPIIRVSNTGITKIISNKGITLKELPIMKRDKLNYKFN